MEWFMTLSPSELLCTGLLIVLGLQIVGFVVIGILSLRWES
jgi:hypothetical protein